MKTKSGIKVLDDVEGIGKPAQKGDTVVYNVKIFLNKGEEVPLNEIQIKNMPKYKIRTVANYSFVDHVIALGRREAIAGVEHSLIGMKEEGYRKVRVSPHLAYREKGIPDLIPQNAVLIIELWLRSIQK